MPIKTKFEYSNVCSACGRHRRKEDLVFDPNTLKPFCYNIQSCNASHPNSYQNVMARNGVLKDLVNYKEAQDVYVENLLRNTDPRTVELMKLANRPTSVRLGSVELADYVLDYRDKHNKATITAAIQAIIREHKEQNFVPDAGPAAVYHEPVGEPGPTEAVENELEEQEGYGEVEDNSDPKFHDSLVDF